MDLKTLRDYIKNKYGGDNTPKKDSQFTRLIAELMANVLKEERAKLGLTQQELAEKLNTNKSYISRIERGDVDLQLSTLFKIVIIGLEKELNITID